MNTRNVYLTTNELPTIMDFNDEISLIEKLMIFDLDDIKNHQNEFKSIILRIQESHADNGIYEITEKNYPIFERFCNWLESLQPHLNFDVSKVCDGLNLSPGEIRASMDVGRRMP